METTNEPVVRDADERAERAKDSLTERIDELSRRFRGAKNMMNVEAQIVEHPWPAVGVALALGALAGMAGSGQNTPAPERSLGGAVIAGVGAVALRLLKSYAFSKLADAAKGWADERGDTSQKIASRDPSVEAFFRQ